MDKEELKKRLQSRGWVEVGPLKRTGHNDRYVFEDKPGGLELRAVIRSQAWELDFNQVLHETLDNKISKDSVRMLDSWTMTIICEQGEKA